MNINRMFGQPGGSKDLGLGSRREFAANFFRESSRPFQPETWKVYGQFSN